MGEYLREDYAGLANKVSSLTSTVNHMKTDQSHWIECFRIVDAVITKLTQVQQLHMDSIWAPYTFTGNYKVHKCLLKRVYCGLELLNSSMCAFQIREQEEISLRNR